MTDAAGALAEAEPNAPTTSAAAAKRDALNREIMQLPEEDDSAAAACESMDKMSLV